MAEHYKFRSLIYGDDNIKMGDFVDLKFDDGKIIKSARVIKIDNIHSLPNIEQNEKQTITSLRLVSGTAREFIGNEGFSFDLNTNRRVVNAVVDVAEASFRELKEKVKKAIIEFGRYDCNPQYSAAHIEIFDNFGYPKTILKVIDFDIEDYEY